MVSPVPMVAIKVSGLGPFRLRGLEILGFIILGLGFKALAEALHVKCGSPDQQL